MDFLVYLRIDQFNYIFSNFLCTEKLFMFSQPLIGSVGLILHEVAVKLKNDYTSPMLCTLASNIFTYFKLQGEGNLKKTYSPLKVYVLSPFSLVDT